MFRYVVQKSLSQMNSVHIMSRVIIKMPHRCDNFVCVGGGEVNSIEYNI